MSSVKSFHFSTTQVGKNKSNKKTVTCHTRVPRRLSMDVIDPGASVPAFGS